MPDVTLRPVIDADLPIFFEQQIDPLAAAMAEFPAREREAFMAHWATICGAPNVVLRTIISDGQVAGNIVSWVQDGKRMIGYWLGHNFWGQGIATRALELFLEERTERPLYAYVAKNNGASRRVLEKCGFRLAGEEEAEVVYHLQNDQSLTSHT